MKPTTKRKPGSKPTKRKTASKSKAKPARRKASQSKPLAQTKRPKSDPPRTRRQKLEDESILASIKSPGLNPDVEAAQAPSPSSSTQKLPEPVPVQNLGPGDDSGRSGVEEEGHEGADVGVGKEVKRRRRVMGFGVEDGVRRYTATVVEGNTIFYDYLITTHQPPFRKAKTDQALAPIEPTTIGSQVSAELRGSGWEKAAGEELSGRPIEEERRASIGYWAGMMEEDQWEGAGAWME